MNILFLGNIGSPIIDLFKAAGDEVTVTSQPLNLKYLHTSSPDFIVSFGYPYLVPQEVIDFIDGKIINLHISYLPWNRGADPDFWGLVDDTPKGVTIHYMDATFDTGDIIVQRKVEPDESDTLATYRDKLSQAIVQLFDENWSTIRSGKCARRPQGERGSYHRSVDKNEFIHLLRNGSDTMVSEIVNAAGRM